MITGASSSISLEQEFRRAAAANNIEKLQELYRLDRGLLNSAGPRTGYTALHQAAARGHLAVVQWLLEQNADCFHRGADGLNAINVAHNNNHHAVFTAFYQHLHKPFATFIDFSNKTTVVPDSVDALANQFALLQLEERLSQTNVDHIRQQAREDALRPFQWININLFKLKLNAAIDENNQLQDSSIKMQQNMANFLNFITASSSEMSHANLFESGIMDTLLRQESERINFSKMKQVANSYFDLLASSHTDKQLNAARANVVSEYQLLLLTACDLKKQHNPSFALLIIFYLAVKGDLFSSHGNRFSREILSAELENEFQAANLLICNSKKGIEPDRFVSEIMTKVIKRLHAQKYVLNINFPLKAEYEHYIKLKNLSSRKRQAPTYIECLSAWDDLMPGGSVSRLLEKAICIRDGLQPRTQFLFMIAANHCTLVDINWDQHDNCFKIIMLDSTNTGLISIIAKELSEKLSKRGFASRYLICPLGVQKDSKSCALYSLMLASHVSYLSFDELNKHPEVKPEKDLQFDENKISFPGLKWLPITAFGEKFILMHQSSTAMRADLRKLYNNDEKKVTQTMNNWKAWYAFPGKPSSSQLDYIGYRRASLYSKSMGTRQSYTTRHILETTNTNDLGPALRKLAAGVGPGAMLSQLLTQVSPVVINERSPTGKTPLDWAYQLGRLGRAQKLLAHGANPEATDSSGLKPSGSRP